MTALWAALLAAQQHAEGLTKAGKNQAQGWNYATVEDVTRIAREALNKAGLVAVLRIPSDVPDDPKQLDAYLHLIHPASGDEARFPVSWPVERPGSQGRRAAYSYARKQALLELLALAEPGDPETDAGSEPEKKPAAATVRRTKRLGSVNPAPYMPAKAPENHPDGPTPTTDPPITPGQLTALHVALKAMGIQDRDAGLALYAKATGRPVDSSKQLTRAEASRILDQLSAPPLPDEPTSDG